MKRVVLIRSNAVKNDPAVEKVASALGVRGYRVTILAWDRDGEYDVKNEAVLLPGGEAEVIRFGIPATFGGGLKKNLPAMVKFQKRVGLWLEKNCDKYDVIHAFDLDTGLVAKRMAKKNKKKFCYHILDFYAAVRFKENTLPYRIVERIENSVINKADATIVCTEARINQIKGSKPKKLTVIHNTPGYITPDSIEKCELKSNRTKIVYVGTLEAVRLIREMLECVMEDETLELHIGGYGVMEDVVRGFAKKCNRIVFYGRLPYRKVLGLEAACDIMTAIYKPGIANHRYAAPNKLYESMMLRKPVIMCKDTGWDEVLQKENTGVVIEYSKEGLKEGLSLLTEKKEEWVTMGENAHRLYNEKYSWEIMYDRLIKLYESL